MNNKFDELAKGMAQSVTRRQALKKFSLGLAGMVLACFGLATGAKAAKQPCLPSGSQCGFPGALPCCHGLFCYQVRYRGTQVCVDIPQHSKGGSGGGTGGT